MPWCPKCKNEFVDGVTHCNDCGQPLVEHMESLDTESLDIESLDTESLDPLNSPLTAFIRPSESALYTKASDQKEEYSSSSFSFLIVSLITFILGILIYTNKIDLTAQPSARIKYLLILFIITILFIVLAFFSNRKSKILSKSVDKEEQQLILISDYMKQQFDTPLDSDYLSMDELFFARNEWILQKLHDYDSNFSDSYLDYLAEYLYQELFEV